MTHQCPVCGFGMDEPPANYNICPCCGTEFGYHDRNASIVQLRANWIRDGLRWWSPVDSVPENWDPSIQVAALLSGNSTPSGDEGDSQLKRNKRRWLPKLANSRHGMTRRRTRGLEGPIPCHENGGQAQVMGARQQTAAGIRTANAA